MSCVTEIVINCVSNNDPKPERFNLMAFVVTIAFQSRKHEAQVFVRPTPSRVRVTNDRHLNSSMRMYTWYYFRFFFQTSISWDGSCRNCGNDAAASRSWSLRLWLVRDLSKSLYWRAVIRRKNSRKTWAWNSRINARHHILFLVFSRRILGECGGVFTANH